MIEQILTILLTILGFLLGMGFAGSFIGRKWMGKFDIFLHRVFKRKVSWMQFLYWKYFCGINSPPKPTVGSPSTLPLVADLKEIFLKSIKSALQEIFASKSRFPIIDGLKKFVGTTLGRHTGREER